MHEKPRRELFDCSRTTTPNNCVAILNSWYSREMIGTTDSEDQATTTSTGAPYGWKYPATGRRACKDRLPHEVRRKHPCVQRSSRPRAWQPATPGCPTSVLFLAEWPCWSGLCRPLHDGSCRDEQRH